jgi:hypothetical protein
MHFQENKIYHPLSEENIMQKNRYKSKCKINKIGVTDDTLTGRGGMVLFVKYLGSVEIYPLLHSFFGDVRRNNKGLPVWNIFKQVFCWFYDGTSRHLNSFDQLKRDDGYASAIENGQEEMVSSHQIKRFYKLFSWLCGGSFRKILRKMFIWRLKLKKPQVVDLTIDTMVMDNDEAQKRYGVQPTYKKVKGFQPLQAIWNGKIVDAIFRGGKKHSNYGNSVVNMIRDLVQVIRQEYSDTVTIIVRMDSGFFDEKILRECDKLGIGFICTGKMYRGVKEHVGTQPKSQWKTYSNRNQEWAYLEFGYRCESWKQFYRAIYTRLSYEGEQRLLDFARPDNVILTNIGVNPKVLVNCSTKKEERRLANAETIIESHHMRGADELPHRGLKDFGFEELPFKRFVPNSVVYYCMLISFFLFETFKEDVLVEVMPIGSYATTVRRKVLDFAAKIIGTGRQLILKVNQAVMDNLRFDILWQRSQIPIPIII